MSKKIKANSKYSKPILELQNSETELTQQTALKNNVDYYYQVRNSMMRLRFGFQVLCYKQVDLTNLFLKSDQISYMDLYFSEKVGGSQSSQIITMKLLLSGNVEFKLTELCTSFFSQTTLCFQMLLLYHLSLLRSVNAALPSLKCLNLMTQTLLFTVLRLAYTLRISKPLVFLLAF